MKKIIALVLCLLFMFAFVGCGGEAAKTDSNANTEPAHSFTYNGVKVEMGVDATDILAGLGEPKSKTEEASCAFEGLDRTYFYGSLYVTTYPNGDKENIYGAWFVDDSVTTDENIYIGATKEEVETAYGADAFDGSNSYVITKGASKLTIIVEDDVVTGITYDAIVE